MNRFLLVFTCAVLVAATILSCRAEVIDDWSPQHPKPYFWDYFNAAYGNGVYVFVGRGGVITTTSDLQNWHTRNHPEPLENVVFGNGLFVATGYLGDMLTSTDGTNWTTHSTGTTLSFSGVTYSNGLYVAAGERGASAVSSNGMDWTIGDTGDTNFWYWGVTYGEGLYVAAATHWDYDGPVRIVTSSNGMDWTAATLPALPAYAELWDVRYADGRFTAVGYFWEDFFPNNEGVLILTSLDGTTWTRVTDPDIPDEGDVGFNNQYWLDEVRHDGTQWIAGGDAELLMTSPDGLDWTVLPRPTGTSYDIKAIAFGPGNTTALATRRGRVYSTSNLTTWTDHFSGTYGLLWKIGAANGQILATSAGNSYLSNDDGETWPYYFNTLNGRNTGIAYGLGHWIVSSDSVSASPHNPLSISPDGINWSNPNTSAAFDDCRGVAFANGIFVAIPKSGTDSLAYSTDATNWTEVAHPWFTAVQDRDYIAASDDHFLAWGYSNATIEVAESSDGMNWTTHDTGIATPVPVAGAYGDGRWVLVGSGGQVLTSTNRVDWSEQFIQFDGGYYYLRGVAYGNGHWVIVGNDMHVWSSSDGVNWDEAFMVKYSGYDFLGVAFDGSSFWIAGDQGAIYQSKFMSGMLVPTLGIQYAGTPSEVELLIGGVAGQMWNVDYKSALTNASWIFQNTVTLTNDNHTAVQILPGSPQGFFRLSEP